MCLEIIAGLTIAFFRKQRFFWECIGVFMGALSLDML
jgi:hypothetical protein